MEGDESIAELRIEGDNLILGHEAAISGGTHHPRIHPDGQLIYVPTADRHVDIVDRESMSVIKQEKAQDTLS